MASLPLFGLLILERDPFLFRDIPGLVQVWLQDAGGFAGLGLIVYLIYALKMPAEQQESAKYRAGVTPWMLAMAVAAILCYSVYMFFVVTGRGGELRPPTTTDPTAFVKYTAPKFSFQPRALALMLGGLFSLLGIGQPFVLGLTRLRFRRIWALSKLSFKEAVSQQRLPWIFLIFLLPILFQPHVFLGGKSEDQLRSSTAYASLLMQFLLILPAAILCAFAIPNDIKNQNIYTIVSKPVERFEIVLGRFFGYGFILTIGLLAMTGVGVLFIVTSTIDEKAASETFMARKPVRGTIKFMSRRGDIEGTNVGREFDYRKYIGGDPSSSQRAVWNFSSIPSRLGRGKDSIPCEFTFDIFRMTKGEENRGVDLTIRVTTWQCPQTPPTEPRSGVWKWADPAQEKAYRDDVRAEVAKLGSGFAGKDPEAALKRAKPGTALWDVVNRLAEKYGYYEFDGKEVFDYHPESIAVPTGLFANARAGSPPDPKPGQPPTPLVSVFVKCNTRGQMLGMAEGDLYFLEDEPTPSPRGFAINYFKWSIGVWCRVMLILGIAVACSTYLAGVLGLLATGFLFLAGFFIEHIADIASGKSYVGGPLRSMNQLMEAKQATMPLDQTSPLTRFAEGGDSIFAWIVRRFINIVPDLEAYRWTHFLSEGFDIPIEYLAMNVVVLIGYVLPWFILAFFLLRSREVAE